MIELDGSQQYDEEGIQKDSLRTQYLESLGLKVLRFSNADIKKLYDVCQQIDLEVKQRYCPDPLPDGVGRSAFSTKNK